ncbi:hypothetical protein KDW_41800 [Dictyobacter vulcani]|uniref:Uncharacterized protein n=1 Tax=Dictyobacter vulcani TaxID=2607529 RepID=A0A5J4KJV3_9CHLR|nr:hypothetical protein [Dictyobacter vulcani]GER90018.1 hypothetical protein KDW_41800 [Dictyobacter vulcani]
MNSSSLPHDLNITNKQAQRLIYYIQGYRRFAWENIEPSAERNAALRALQALHGRIVSKMDQRDEYIILSLMPEEHIAMKMMVNNILGYYEMSPATRERAFATADLTALKTFLDDKA